MYPGYPDKGNGDNRNSNQSRNQYHGYNQEPSRGNNPVSSYPNDRQDYNGYSYDRQEHKGGSQNDRPDYRGNQEYYGNPNERQDYRNQSDYNGNQYEQRHDSKGYPYDYERNKNPQDQFGNPGPRNNHQNTSHYQYDNYPSDHQQTYPEKQQYYPSERIVGNNNQYHNKDVTNQYSGYSDPSQEQHYPPHGSGGYPYPNSGPGPGANNYQGPQQPYDDPKKYPPKQLPPKPPIDQYPPRNQMEQYPPRNQIEQYPPRNQIEQYPPRGTMEQYPPKSQIEQYPPKTQKEQYPPPDNSMSFGKKDGAFGIPSEYLNKKLPTGPAIPPPIRTTPTSSFSTSSQAVPVVPKKSDQIISVSVLVGGAKYEIQNIQMLTTGADIKEFLRTRYRVNIFLLNVDRLNRTLGDYQSLSDINAENGEKLTGWQQLNGGSLF